MSKFKILLSVCVVLVVGLFVWQPWSEKSIGVWQVTAELGPVESTVTNTRAGTIKACRRSKLSMPAGGVVSRLEVTEGQYVEQGELLLELWNKDNAALIAQAQSSLNMRESEKTRICLQADLKQREAKRQSQLLAKKLTSIEEADNARTTARIEQTACTTAELQVQIARSNLDLHTANFELTQLRAPFAGVVAEIEGEIGEYVTPSPPGILTPAAVDLIDLSCLYVSAPIDEIDAASVRVGQKATITLDAYRNRELPGTVSRIAPYVLDLEKQARTVAVEVQIEELPPEVKLLVGYSADISVILARKENQLRLPTETISLDQKVWRINADHRLEQVSIVTGLSNWSFTEVIEGLNVGDQIVRNPDADNIKDGQLVSINND